ncbi:hypothetical protein GV829_04625 [Sphingomonas lacunae]|uniref:Uncharacterized protein n=1 Tax=Sphingomonas lacunae TaxID=2698828 RepID=A0A6M4ATR7_9SPHN|nr:hypothetical protein [Sphingomonas lacunae]QJQ31820.1 hypothetical protein GV829_04625 [Sphingomonas lacunae]
MSEAVAGGDAVVAPPADAGAGGADAGGAAALLSGGGDGAPPPDGGSGNGGGGDPWYAGLPDEDRSWAEKKGFADLPAALKSYRELEGRYLSGDKLVVPKEGDPQEVFDRYYAAIGRPEAPDKYEFKAPDGHELDADLTGRIGKKAFEAGVPQAMLAPLVDEFNAYVLEQQQTAEAARIAAKNEGVAEVRREWGDNFDSRIAQANQAMRMLELTPDDIGALEDAWGTPRVLRLMHKLGAGMGEDALIGGGAAQRFSLSPAEARAERERLESDPDHIKRYMSGDKASRERMAMLNQIIAADEERRRNG